MNLQEGDSGGHSRYTALHCAARMGHIETATLLLERGAKADVLDKHGNTPKNLAEKKGDSTHKAMIELLDKAEQAAASKKK